MYLSVRQQIKQLLKEDRRLQNHCPEIGGDLNTKLLKQCFLAFQTPRHVKRQTL